MLMDLLGSTEKIIGVENKLHLLVIKFADCASGYSQAWMMETLRI